MVKIGCLGSSGTQQLHRETGGWAWVGSIIQISHRAWWELMEDDYKTPRIWKGIKRRQRLEAGGTRAAEMNYKWLCWKPVSGFKSVLLCCQWLRPQQLHTNGPEGCFTHTVPLDPLLCEKSFIVYQIHVTGCKAGIRIIILLSPQPLYVSSHRVSLFRSRCKSAECFT